MVKHRNRRKIVLGLLGLLAAGVYLTNTSRLADPLPGDTFLVAHRALGQEFDREGLTGRTCTASRMLSTDHGYLENTIPAMKAAFELGADMVELDIHPTVDGHFAVFHDWTVDCRTEGSGVTRDHTLAELQSLDIGYGYTADHGKSWPFRGKGVGMIPSLTQVLETFPDRSFLIDIKGNDANEGIALAARLDELASRHRGEIALTGGPRPVGEILQRRPGTRSITRRQLKACLPRYLAGGWTGYVPRDCRNRLLMVPANVAPWLWGWPHRFSRRMDAVGTQVVLIGDYRGGKFSDGLDDPDRAREMSSRRGGGIFTNRIDLVGPAVRSKENP